jgi:signal transduction histidine kinase
MLFPLAGFLVARVSRDQKSDRRELAEKNVELARYATTVEQLTISHERNRMARDLHDTLAHTLSAVSVQLEALNAQFDSDTTGARETLRRTRELTRNGLQEVRRALNALRASPLEDLGLAQAIRRQAESTAERSWMNLALDITDDLDGLRPEVEGGLYRITGEALYNAARHANAQHMTVSLLRDEHELQLTVSDDGIGFDPEARSGDGQYGIKGMNELAKLFSGRLITDSEPGVGTTVRLIVEE